MARARVVTDLTAQCRHMGDLNHAIDAGTMQVSDVHAELGELVAGRKPGRTQAHEITLFDGCGVGIQDVAASARAYQRARERNAGRSLSLGGLSGRGHEAFPSTRRNHDNESRVRYACTVRPRA